MLYKMTPDAPFQFRKFMVLPFLGLILTVTSCREKLGTNYFISYQELERRIGPLHNIVDSKTSDSIIQLYNKIDTISVVIKKSEIKIIRGNETYKSHYTSFTSLDSVIEVLKKNRFDSLHIRGERNEPKIFFVDVKKDNLIRIIPAKQIYQLSKDNYDIFH